MNIGIDIDDTLTNSFDYFIPFVAEYFGVSVDFCIQNEISYSTLPDEWKEKELDFSKKYFDSVVEDTPFKEDAANIIRKLHTMGHKIYIITARNESMYTNPYLTTQNELKNGNIVYDKLICTLDKANACINEKIDILIDDSVANCTAANNKGITVILFTSKGNYKSKTPFCRVKSWQELYEKLKSNYL